MIEISIIALISNSFILPVTKTFVCLPLSIKYFEVNTKKKKKKRKECQKGRQESSRSSVYLQTAPNYGERKEGDSTGLRSVDRQLETLSLLWGGGASQETQGNTVS
jgi:hypothetical protein